MNWKSVLYTFLAALLPVIYELGIKNNPEFPLSQSDFVSTILWIIAAIVGGWQAKKFQIERKSNG